MGTLYLVLADAILVLHALLVIFNITALPIIWLGHVRHWPWVRNFAFRISHLVLIGFVAAEAFLGAMCPLTTWEDALRVRAGATSRYEGGYIAHWLHQVMFYDLPAIVFTLAYGAFFALVLFTWFWVKPDPPRRFRLRAR